MKLVIGIVGSNGAGKDSVEKILMANFANRGLDKVRTFSSYAIISDALNACGISASRHNAQEFVRVMMSAFGEDFLSNAVQRRIELSGAQISIYNCLRLPSDEKMIRSLEVPGTKAIIVCVTARAELRYERRKKASEKPGEKEMTWHDFLKEDRAITERNIADIGSRADEVIHNFGTMGNLQIRVANFFEEMVWPYVK